MRLQSFLPKTRSAARAALPDAHQRGNLPRRERDINAGTNRVLDILRHRVSRDLARRIYTRTRAASAVHPGFDLPRLRRHLSSYCLECFSAAQLHELHTYLTAGGRMR